MIGRTEEQLTAEKIPYEVRVLSDMKDPFPFPFSAGVLI